MYLPSGAGWYDFMTDAWLNGGEAVDAPAPLEVIPVFVRAGAIVPMSPAMQYADEIQGAPYEIRVIVAPTAFSPFMRMREITITTNGAAFLW